MYKLWLDLRNVIHLTSNHAGPGINREVKQFHIMTNGPPVTGGPDVKFLWDHIFPTDEPYTVNYFHNDYLGSARVITDDDGTVVWRMDYYPFGEDRALSDR